MSYAPFVTYFRLILWTVRRRSRGLYPAVLRLRDDKLDCTLRLTRDAGTLILYLSDEPFHQLTYARK